MMRHPISYPSESPLARGWNTWDTRSVLRQVLLPDGLALDLSFHHPGMLASVADAQFGSRDVKATAGVRLAAAEFKPQAIRIRPGPHAFDGRYTQLIVTLGNFQVTVETAHVDGADLVVLVTPSPAPYRAPLLVVEGSFRWNRPGWIEAVSETEWRVHSPRREGLAVCVTTAGVDAPYFAPRTPSWVLPMTGSVGIGTGRPRALAEIEGIVAAARRAESESHFRWGALGPSHAAMQACLAWDTIYDPSHRRVLTTVSREWNVRRFGFGIFGWDSFLTAWLLAIDEPGLARNMVREAFRAFVDGEFVPNVVNGSGRCSRDRSQPCVGALAVLALHELAPESDFLAEVWPALLAWNRWWHRQRRNNMGLLSWGSHPFTPQIGDAAEFLQPNTARGAALESGLDNSPMYDEVPFDSTTHLMSLSDVGLASLYIVDCEALAALARELDRTAEAEELEDRARTYRERLGLLWNEATGIFQNRRTDTGEFHPGISPTSFYPMLAGATTAPQVEVMLQRHLLHPEVFWGEWVLPSAPRTDPAFKEQHYLRGRIWAPLNFLVYLGLRRCGRTEPATELARRSLALFKRNWSEAGGAFENYSAITGRGDSEGFCDPLYTWSGLLVLMALMDAQLIPIPSILRPAAPSSHPSAVVR